MGPVTDGDFIVKLRNNARALIEALRIQREALEAIKKHYELTHPTAYEMSMSWNITKKALKQTEELLNEQ